MEQDAWSLWICKIYWKTSKKYSYLGEHVQKAMDMENKVLNLLTCATESALHSTISIAFPLDHIGFPASLEVRCDHVIELSPIEYGRN